MYTHKNIPTRKLSYLSTHLRSVIAMVIFSTEKGGTEKGTPRKETKIKIISVLEYLCVIKF
jgi:hypothetical protein